MKGTSDAFKVLLIEDNPWDAQVAAESLLASTEGTYEVVHVNTIAGAREALALSVPDAIVLDLNLPDSKGSDTLDWAQTATGRSVPIIVMTSKFGADFASALLRQGANDYVLKDELDTQDLGRAVRYAIERQRATDEVFAEGEALKRVFDALPDVVIVVDLDGKLVRWNRPLERSTGHAPGELMGMPFADLVPGSHKTVVLDAMHEALRGGGPPGEIAPLLRKDGTTILYLWTNAPLPGPDGRVTGLIRVGKSLESLRALMRPPP